MDVDFAKLGLLIMLYSMQQFGVDSSRIIDAMSNYTLPSERDTNNPSAIVEDSSLQNSTAPSVASSEFPDAGFLVGCAVLVVLILLAVGVFLWRIRRLTAAAQRRHSVHRGIILAYSSKYSESGLDDMSTTEAGCVNSGFSESKTRKTGQREDIATIAGKLGFANASQRSVRRSLSVQSDYKSTVVIRKHDTRNQRRLQPPRPTCNEATSSEGTYTTTLSTSAPPVGFSRFFPVEGDVIFSAAAEHIYDVPRETTLHRRASNPEMGHTRVYDTPDASGTGRHVSDPLPQIENRRLSSRSSQQTGDTYDNAEENIYDVPRNCEDFDTASVQFVVDDIYDAPAETDDIYVIPMNSLPIPTYDSTVVPTLSSVDIDSSLITQLDENTGDTVVLIAPQNSSKPSVPPNPIGDTVALIAPQNSSKPSVPQKPTDDTAVLIAPQTSRRPSVPPKPPRRRAKAVQPENVYAVPRKVSPSFCTPNNIIA